MYYRFFFYEIETLSSQVLFFVDNGVQNLRNDVTGEDMAQLGLSNLL